jgi:restriction system protein
MLPLLKLASDKNDHSIREATDQISKQFNLTDAEKNEVMPNGKQRVIDDRTMSARYYMLEAGLLEGVPRRGSYFRITDEGLRALAQNPDAIDIKFLEQYPSFLEFQKLLEKIIESPTQTRNARQKNSWRRRTKK